MLWFSHDLVSALSWNTFFKLLLIEAVLSIYQYLPFDAKHNSTYTYYFSHKLVRPYRSTLFDREKIESIGLVYRTCVLMAESSECGFELWPRLWCLCTWPRHFIQEYKLWGPVREERDLCLIKLVALHIWQHGLHTPDGVEMVLGTILQG